MFKNDEIRLHHILDASREAMSFAERRGISEQYRAVHPEIAWKKMAGMRDRLIHGYFDVNLDVAGQTLTEDLPPSRSTDSKRFVIQPLSTLNAHPGYDTVAIASKQPVD